MAAEELDPRYIEGINAFNQASFFQAHEVWEEIWTECYGPARPFYQGLIQTAVCLHHFGRHNTRGARKLFHSSRRYLEPFRPQYLGLDLDRLLDDMQACCSEIASSDEAFPKARLDPDLLPKIELDGAPADE